MKRINKILAQTVGPIPPQGANPPDTATGSPAKESDWLLELSEEIEEKGYSTEDQLKNWYRERYKKEPNQEELDKMKTLISASSRKFAWRYENVFSGLGEEIVKISKYVDPPDSLGEDQMILGSIENIKDTMRELYRKNPDMTFYDLVQAWKGYWTESPYFEMTYGEKLKEAVEKTNEEFYKGSFRKVTYDEIVDAFWYSMLYSIYNNEDINIYSLAKQVIEEEKEYREKTSRRSRKDRFSKIASYRGYAYYKVRTELDPEDVPHDLWLMLVGDEYKTPVLDITFSAWVEYSGWKGVKRLEDVSDIEVTSVEVYGSPNFPDETDILPILQRYYPDVIYYLVSESLSQYIEYPEYDDY